jgi:PTH1 family peptidyl-tRNA hydrolase
MKLFVGLGNPGPKYARHRHNVGFMAVERIADEHHFSSWRKRFQGETAEGEIAGERVVLLKPQTYMNESGRSVGEAARFLKIESADIIVFHDELDLAPGRIKVKAGGGTAGHNGLRSVDAHIGNEFQRVRIGIGHPGHKDAVQGYVLHDFAKADQDWLAPLLDAIAKSAGRLARGDGARFLTDVARRMQGTAEPGEEQAERPAASRVQSRPHPAGERMGKRESALAENLAKWLKGRKRDL